MFLRCETDECIKKRCLGLGRFRSILWSLTKSEADRARQKWGTADATWAGWGVVTPAMVGLVSVFVCFHVICLLSSLFFVLFPK